ncbi:MAG: M23 family metallopeptidase [bacterium]|nr:M23 family metallopeptidase [bacterium]
MISREGGEGGAGRIWSFELPRLPSLRRALVYGMGALSLALMIVLMFAIVEPSSGVGGAMDEDLRADGRQLLEKATQTRERLIRLHELHLAINERLFVGPEVSARWYTLPQLTPDESVALNGTAGGADFVTASDARGLDAVGSDPRRLSPAYLKRRLAALDQLFQQNKNYVQVYGGYLRGVPHRWPVVYGPRKINSNFGYRANPFYGQGGSGKRKLHRGVDLKGKRGDLVVSAAEGVVLEARRSSRGYGNRVRVFHPSGYTTLYAHLSKIYVKPNQYLKPGDHVGAVGSTGHSTGPHLHYEVHRGRKAINPAEFIAEE